VNPGLRFFSDAFANSLVIGSICVGLMVWALYIWIDALRLVRRVQRDARNARGVFDHNRSIEEMCAAVTELRKSPLRDRLDSELRDTALCDGRTYRLSVAGEPYESLIYEYADIRTLDAWPNIFIGVGLLLTFLGLALSLLNASIGAASGDITIVKQSVTTLLEFSASKFSTSLVALFCSLALGILLRKQRHRMEECLHAIEAKLDIAIPRLTSERIALYSISDEFQAKQHASAANTMLTFLFQSTEGRLAAQALDDILEQSREQTAQLTSFNSGLAIQLAEALESKMQPALAHLTDRVETALREMGGSIGETNQGALKELLDSFVSELRGATKTDSDELQRNIQQLAGDLSRTSHELSDRMASVFSGLESTGTRFADVLTDAGAAFRTEMGRVQTDVGAGLAGALAALNEAATRSSNESEAMLSKIAAGASSFKESVEGGALSFVGELDRGVRSIDTVVERLSESVVRLGALIDRAAVFAETSSVRTGERIAALQSTLAEVDAGFRRVGEASEPFARAAEHVRGAVDLLRVTQTAVQAKVAALESAANVMAASSNSFSTAVERDVSRLADGLGTTTDRLTAAITSIAQESESAGSVLAETIRHTLEEYERRFSGIDRELQTALEMIVGTFANTYEEMRQRITIVDSQMAESVGKLAMFNETFGEHAEELNDGVAKLSKALAARS
jgi:hypothetical protein